MRGATANAPSRSLRHAIKYGATIGLVTRPIQRLPSVIRGSVDRAVGHAWSIPEFQRGFVWKMTQVRDIAESLWLDCPIGSLLVWNSQDHAEERVVTDAQRPTLWVVDGQQRVTALCILFGRKPYWWQSGEEWERTVKKYDIRFDINAKEHEKFELPLYWFLQASRFSRYSGSGTTSLEEDLRDIQDADSLNGAVRRLLRRFAHTTPIDAEDFMREYGDSRFGRPRRALDGGLPSDCQ